MSEKYIHFFETEQTYDNARKQHYKEPWTSLTNVVTGQTSKYRVNYNKTKREKLLEQPLTFKITGPGVIKWCNSQSGYDDGWTIYYKKNNGSWTSIYSGRHDQTIGVEIQVTTGDIVQFKGDNSTYDKNYYDAGDDMYKHCNARFTNSTCAFTVEGNVMSLIDSSNPDTATFANNTGYNFSNLFYQCAWLTDASDLLLPATTATPYCYYYMFSGCPELINPPEISATTLANYCCSYMFNSCLNLRTAPILPATTLADSCYSGMFFGCGALHTAPKLPATTLANHCYNRMFNGCHSLTVTPILPATTLADYCYYYMFGECTYLTTALELPATTLAQYCYSNMFYNCKRLTTAPELPATTLADYCYSSMFYYCESLTTAPALPATTLTLGCYSAMFRYCASLTTAPDLPATTLAQSCYSTMFEDCTSLTTAPSILPATTLAQNCYWYMFCNTPITTAPELPAETLVNNCYSYMFKNCTNLNYIKAMFTTTPALLTTIQWVQNVAATGTFVKNSSATWNVTGHYGVPSGWTVQTASS